MPRRFPDDHLNEPASIESPALGRAVFIALGLALLIGLVAGVVWIVWNLFNLHVLQ